MSELASHPCPQPLHDVAETIFRAGIIAADPYRAVKRCLAASPQHLDIALEAGTWRRKRSGRWHKIRLVSFGKAACAMAKAAVEVIPEHMFAGNGGIIVTNYENITPVDRCEVIGAGHPLPDAAGLAAAEKVEANAKQAKEHELLLVLISGGGSALLPCPIPPVSLEEKTAATQLLLSCGATINQINSVRKHLSRLKGGGVARLAAPADVHALILSDVLGDDLSAIASGPTVPDDTTFADAVAVLHAYKVWEQAPKTVRKVLQAGLRGEIPETAKDGNPLFARCSHTLVGSNAVSLEAMVKAAEAQGYRHQLYSDQLCGEAREAAEGLAAVAQTLLAENLENPIAVLAGGETTVTLCGSGEGGRNQEMALAFALAAERLNLSPYWVFLSGGTDGRDGPTDAAGGIVDPLSLQHMRDAGLDPAALLADNNSYAALQAAHGLLDTGATGTNVADLQVLLINPLI
jgi:glycerate 2-kinase